MKRIIIAENIKLIRERAKEILSEYEVDTTDNGKELIKLYKLHKPDLLIIDIKMPVLSGFEAIEIIRKEDPKIKILIYSVISEKGWIKRLLKYKVSYLYKDEVSESELRHAVKMILSNEVQFLSPAIQKSIRYDNSNEDLTCREIEVVEKLKEGKTPKDISTDLFLSVKTVRTHIKNIHRKLNVKTIVELINSAEKMELI